MKNIKILFCIAVFLITISFNGCDDDDPWCWIMECWYAIWIQNNSSSPINYLVSNNYPDTIIPEKILGGIAPTQKVPYDSRKKWKEVFRDELGKDTLSIFFFSRDTIINHEWDQVRHNYMVLKRYDLSYHDLEKLNYTVPYPPSSEMNQMKIYIPSP